jgi:hypothetical protein
VWEFDVERFNLERLKIRWKLENNIRIKSEIDLQLWKTCMRMQTSRALGRILERM